MSEGKRPGGLTALAVINFVWGGLTGLAGMGMIAVPALMEFAAKNGGSEGAEARRKFQEMLERIGPVVWYAIIGLVLVSALLLILSGIGYLKQKRMMGRTLGTIWAVLSIVATVAELVLVADATGPKTGMEALVNVVYPVLTLWLLNVTFKEDFIR